MKYVLMIEGLGQFATSLFTPSERLGTDDVDAAMDVEAENHEAAIEAFCELFGIQMRYTDGRRFEDRNLNGYSVHTIEEVKSWGGDE